MLVGDGDRAVLGAAIMLPDHPELAPESLGNLFDNTEIEEALLLHVQTLSDDEREGIAEQDPAVQEMIERADKVSNDEMLEPARPPDLQGARARRTRRPTAPSSCRPPGST